MQHPLLRKKSPTGVFWTGIVGLQESNAEFCLCAHKASIICMLVFWLQIDILVGGKDKWTWPMWVYTCLSVKRARQVYIIHYVIHSWIMCLFPACAQLFQSHRNVLYITSLASNAPPLVHSVNNEYFSIFYSVLVAELIRFFIPRMVELHNYSPGSSTRVKEHNWYYLNK
jgi:hypothetical protein